MPLQKLTELHLGMLHPPVDSAVCSRLVVEWMALCWPGCCTASRAPCRPSGTSMQGTAAAQSSSSPHGPRRCLCHCTLSRVFRTHGSCVASKCSKNVIGWLYTEGCWGTSPDQMLHVRTACCKGAVAEKANRALTC